MAVRDIVTFGVGPGSSIPKLVTLGFNQAVVTGFTPIVTFGIGPQASIKHLVTLGFNIGAAVGSPIPVFVHHYRQQGFM